MALDFPNSPTIGQIYTSVGKAWVWDGVKWIPSTSSGVAPTNAYVIMSPVLPVGATDGMLWWDTLSGQLFVWFNDGNSSQWIVANSSINTNTQFLPLVGGTLTGPLTVQGNVLVGGTALGGKTRFEFNPTNPGGTGAALFMNRQASSDGHTQIRSNLRVDYAAAGSTAARHVMLETIQTTNAKDVWPILNRSYTNANTDASTHVGMFSLQLRTGVLAGGSGGVAMWCHVMEARSQTGLPSSQDGILQPLEVDIFANGADDRSPSIGRTCISVVIGKDNPGGATCEVTHGISFYGSGGSYKRIIGAAASYSQSVLDTRSALAESANAHAIWLKTGHTIGLDDAGVGGQPKFAVRSNGTKCFIAVDGVDKFSIDASGNVRASGTITGSVTP